MASSVTYVDELVKDYLIYRGFIGTLKTMETELKNDKEHAFRVDKIVEQITGCISSYDLNLLKETWSHLDKRVFSKCELRTPNAVINKLESSIYKMYVVNCISNNKSEKLLEFFEKMSLDLQGNPDWKDWFVIPFVKGVDEHPMFAMYFSRHWMETMLVSLHNFISVSLHTMSVPALLAYEDEQAQIASLQEENEMLKKQVIALKQSQNISSRLSDVTSHGSAPFLNRTELMDDFYVIAQEPHVAETQMKSIKSLIRNIGSGLPISPILTRRHQSTSHPKHAADVPDNSDSAPTNPSSVSNEPSGPAAGMPNPGSKSIQASKQDKKGSSFASAEQSKSTAPSAKHKSAVEAKILTSSPKASHNTKEAEVQKKKAETKAAKIISYKAESTPADDQDTIDSAPRPASDSEGDADQPFLLLSQEEYAEHHSIITHCKFNASGSAVASSDLDGVIKLNMVERRITLEMKGMLIWSPNPVPRTLNTVVSRTSILSMEWARKGDRLLLHGNRNGILRLYDTQENRTLAELASDAKNSLKDHSILSIASSPMRSSFAVSALHNKAVTADRGKLFDCDMKTMKIQRVLTMNKSTATIFNCCVFNHNSQLLLGGTAHGRLALFDIRSTGCIASWVCHDNVAVNTVQFSADETSCFSLGANNQFNKWNINKTGEKISQFNCSSASNAAASSSSVQVSTGKLFSLHDDKNLVLMCGQTGGVLKHVMDNSLKTAMNLGGHKSPVVTVDWSTAMDCGMCVTGSIDGRIRVSTLLAH